MPFGIQRTADGFVLDDDHQRLVWLDRNLRATASFDLLTVEAGTEIWLEASDIEGREAIGLLTRDRPGQPEDYGFFRLRLEPGGGTGDLIDPIPMPPGRAPTAGPTWRDQAYLFTVRSLVRLGDRVLWFRLSEELRLSLVEYRAGKLRVLPVIPAAYSLLPQKLPEHVTFEDTTSIFQQLESATMISQLVTDGRRVFLLGHTPGPRGQRWTLFAVNAAGDGIEFQRDLPTTANEIIMLPGERETAVIEIGAAHLLERRPQSFLFLDNEWLAPPARGKALATTCAPASAR